MFHETVAVQQPGKQSRHFRAAPQAIVSPPTKLAAVFEAIGSSLSFPRNGEIYGEGEPARSIYKVVSGTVRTCKLLDDGRRQINGFHLRGDVFGIGIDTEHRFSAEAVTAAGVIAVDRNMLAQLAARDCGLANELWTTTVGELNRMRDLMITLGRRNAQERVSAFLLEMASHASAGNEIELSMSRQDIADYLGLTIETVSRTFTQLENIAAIKLVSCRRVILKDRQALQHLDV